MRPSLRIDINPHLVSDDTISGATEFSTFTYEPDPGTAGWVTHSEALTESHWYLTGDAGETTGCNNDAVANLCTFAQVLAELSEVDEDLAPPAISTGVYFGLGSGITPPTETAVDEFVFNDFVFDFEPTGVFLSPVTP